ncbi:TRAP transporter large permease [Rhodobacteraceae bacterium RKSG542]|uniref:TRAP transporter large permease n=1 Tax=Pseudovibrio flavus TaxID=2529854 RepID=UPI0012BD48A6|nr:TRAP transporter large permease [Pseudovibrio flavus]MTI18142.1 TRAP transporter large permease [Pseudovibrio flavus]
MISMVLFGSFAILVAFGAPVGVCLGMASLIVLELLPNTPPVTLLVKSAVTGANNFVLVAVPMFILAGDIMQGGGLSRRIVASAARLVGNVKAGLAYVNILASMFFAAISGSSPATVAAIGSNMVPEMEKRGYDRGFSSALTAASGMIGVMIPPSIPFIIYGVTANQSIGDLFLGGVIPGILFGAGYAVIARYLFATGATACKSPLNEAIEKLEEHNRARAQEKAETAQSDDGNTIWALLVPVIILGGIYGGIFTPTEAAAVAVGYAFFISMFVYKELKWEDLPELLSRTAITSATCLIMVVMAFAFGRLLTMEQVPNQVADLITTVSDNPIIVLALINILLLLVGMFMETVAAIIILTPILLPVAQSVGVDQIHFGVIMTCNLAIGFCTPPLGANLFVASSIGEVSLERVVKALIPFIYAMIVCLLLITYVPAFSTFLPSLMN